MRATTAGPGGRGAKGRGSEVATGKGATNTIEDAIAQLHGELYMRSNLSQSEEEQIELTLRYMDEWHFDVLVAADVLDMNLIPVVILKLMICYDLVESLNLDFDLLFNFAAFAQERHRSLNFHGPAHAASMAQSCHWFLQHGAEE